jgi:hypothetical protein
MRIHLAFAVGTTVVVAGLSLMAQGAAPTVAVFKDPNCGCCANWVEHLKQNGFLTTVTDSSNMQDVKDQHHVPAQARSCHTGVVNGYAIEGHVPAADIHRLLKERPANVIGIAVPGMPVGSPGMEVAAMKVQPFDVVAFGKDGRTTVFASHNR